MDTISSYFGSLVFNDKVMQESLPQEIYRALKKTVRDGKDLDITIANAVANSMKEWAISHGATHYTHWFQPMTGMTAEKHESFISPTKDGRVLMEFSGKELIKGEPDASSFPSGGLRATFEARGYTAWDPTSYAFLKDNTLCIPTAFCSYSGEALDKKTPLLRSMEALSDSAVRLLHLFGKTDVKRVITTAGPEQEYFLVDRELYLKRKDLIHCGRTLLGAKPPKGQELEDHYFGSIRPRVSAYMQDLDRELWKLGILAKTRHNEVAPSQHELASIYETSNLAVDHNQLIMEMMKKIADKHGLACLLHEKPFAGVNGSGKHNNWSIATDTGINLLEPGDSPIDNAQFLIFLVAIVKAVDEYQDLLRVSVASAGNDHRLGANEAPPAIVSVYLGEELTAILDSLANGTTYDGKGRRSMRLGVHVLPSIPKDSTDRNRTSPFAFTGNKFEFRMLGSSFSVSGPNIILNTVVAKELDEISDKLEGAKDFKAALSKIVVDTYLAHKRIVFNGNNYSDEWVVEAAKRGLLNLHSTPDALPAFVDPKNAEVFDKYHVFNGNELHSRYDILVENYIKTINIEALTMVEMIRKQVLPASSAFSAKLASEALAKKSLDPQLAVAMEKTLVKRFSDLEDSLFAKVEDLDDTLLKLKNLKGIVAAKFCREELLAKMQEARAVSDEIEGLVGQGYWPFPTYGELLFSV